MFNPSPHNRCFFSVGIQKILFLEVAETSEVVVLFELLLHWAQRGSRRKEGQPLILPSLAEMSFNTHLGEMLTSPHRVTAD